MGDGQGGLGDHAAFLGIFDGKLEVAVVVEAAEGTGDVGALLLLDLEHQFAHVRGDRIHPEGVEAALQHVGLDACLVERGRPLADGDVGVLAVEEVHLLEGAAVGLHAVEASHIDDGRCDPDQLVHARLVFAGGLPHIPVNEGEFYFFCHNSTKVIIFLCLPLAGKKYFCTFVTPSEYGAISSVGRAPDCGSGCRGFEPHIAPLLQLSEESEGCFVLWAL